MTSSSASSSTWSSAVRVAKRKLDNDRKLDTFNALQQWQESFDPTQHTAVCVDWMLQQPGRHPCVCVAMASASAPSSDALHLSRAAPASASTAPGRAAPASASPTGDLSGDIAGRPSQLKRLRINNPFATKVNDDDDRDIDKEMRSTIHWAITLATNIPVQGVVDIILDSLFVVGVGTAAPFDSISHNMGLQQSSAPSSAWRTAMREYTQCPLGGLSLGLTGTGIARIETGQFKLLVCTAHYERLKVSYLSRCMNCGSGNGDILPCVGVCPRNVSSCTTFGGRELTADSLTGFDGHGCPALVKWRNTDAIDLMLLSGRVLPRLSCDEFCMYRTYVGPGRRPDHRVDLDIWSSVIWRVARSVHVSNVIARCKLEMSRGGIWSETYLRAQCGRAEGEATAVYKSHARVPSQKRVICFRWTDSEDTDRYSTPQEVPVVESAFGLLDDEADSIEVPPLARTSPHVFGEATSVIRLNQPGSDDEVMFADFDV